MSSQEVRENTGEFADSDVSKITSFEYRGQENINDLYRI